MLKICIMPDRPSSVCANCPAWEALAPEIDRLTIDVPNDTRSRMTAENLRATALGLEAEAEEQSCRSMDKEFAARPSGELAVGSSGLIEYVSQCPALAGFLSKVR